ADSVSAFGSIIALNQIVDAETATEVAKIFVEAIVAPGYAPGALSILSAKKNMRLMQIQPGEAGKKWSQFEIKRVSGGILLQDLDNVLFGGESRIVTQRKPAESEHRDLHFAWRVAKHVK